MPRYDDVQTLVAALNTASNEAGTRVAFVLAQIERTAAEGLNGPQTEWVIANLTPLVPSLNALAANAGNPVPPPIEPPTEPSIPGPLRA